MVGSQTVEISSPITVGTGASATVVSLNTNSAGSVQVVVAGSTQGLASYMAAASSAGLAPSAVTKAPALSTITGAPTILTLGVATVSKDSNGAYMLGGTTLLPDMSVTQTSRGSTNVVALQTSGGSSQLVVIGNSTTASTFLPNVTQTTLSTETQSPSPSSIPAQSSTVVVSGHTYAIGGATLNAAASSTSPTATGGSKPGLANAAPLTNVSGLFTVVLATVIGFVLLL